MAYADKKKATKNQNRWIAEKYDRINLTVPKGQKAVVQEYAECCHMSVNRFIWEAIVEKMEKDPERFDFVIGKAVQERMERENAEFEDENGLG